jgi:hypothetical protein
VDTEDGVTSVCGDGPGTLCNGPGCDACGEDGDVIEYCQDGKLAADSCLRICTEDGIDGITFEHGLCQADGGVVDCFCCDSGEEGCPI